MFFYPTLKAPGSKGWTTLFHLLSKLYERASVIITTNLIFSEWGNVFIDDKLIKDLF